VQEKLLFILDSRFRGNDRGDMGDDISALLPNASKKLLFDAINKKSNGNITAKILLKQVMRQLSYLDEEYLLGEEPE
jgi:hypothetical protein